MATQKNTGLAIFGFSVALSIRLAFYEPTPQPLTAAEERWGRPSADSRPIEVLHGLRYYIWGIGVVGLLIAVEDYFSEKRKKGPSGPPPPLPSEQKTNRWPFDQPENCVVVTTTHVTKQGCDIVDVFHDEDDHGWQFHGTGEKGMGDAMLVALKTIVAHDASVLEVADLPPGWKAWREKRGAAWQRAKNEQAG